MPLFSHPCESLFVHSLSPEAYVSRVAALFSRPLNLVAGLFRERERKREITSACSTCPRDRPVREFAVSRLKAAATRTTQSTQARPPFIDLSRDAVVRGIGRSPPPPLPSAWNASLRAKVAKMLPKDDDAAPTRDALSGCWWISRW